MQSLKEQVAHFAKERDWEKFHSPKNLAMGLSVETSELLEIFLWLTEEESHKLPESKLADLKEEIGDIMIYITNIANKFNIDPIECAKQKIELNRTKYPSELVRGSAKKYTEYKK
ncbi:MAG: nucleotide pyrophosphohydrolase [Desulfobulbaceae bacterium]|nr:nucleotide pyrophosphohydrolase [Desulfobulbaceae bacterium]